jgi:hypothetical protein
MELGEHFDGFFHSHLLKIEAVMDGFLGAGLAKNKFCTDTLGLLRPKTTIYLC